MKFCKLTAAVFVCSCCFSAAAAQPYLFKFLFKGVCYQKDASGNLVVTNITDQTLLQDRAAAGGLDPNTLAIAYHLGGDPKGDTIEIIRTSDNAKLAFEFGFWFGDDTSLGRLAVTNNAGTEIRRVDQVFTLENSTYTWSNGHGVGSAVTGKRFITDSLGNQHWVFDGRMEWMVNAPSGVKICSGTWSASQPMN